MPVLEEFGADALRNTVIAFRDTMKRHASGINRLNVYPVPDGDTGTNMARTLDAVVTELEGASPGLETTCEAISHGSLMGARGNSGVILSQILRGLSATLKTAQTSGAQRVAEALKAASAAAYEAVLKPIEGTILTVVRETAEAATKAANEGASLVVMLRDARNAGRKALDNTPELLPVLKDAGVVDAGGAGFYCLWIRHYTSLMANHCPNQFMTMAQAQNNLKKLHCEPRPTVQLMSVSCATKLCFC